MKYTDYLKINDTFQYSINLQFDINNIEKIKSYIPTNDSCMIMEYYLDSINGKFNKSTTLIGPYGKGKSHLLLVLMTLLNDYEKEDEEVIKSLLVKIKNVNAETYEKFVQIRKAKLKYMPVIINSNYNNMNQAFLLALTESLEREGINDIVVNTYFDAALEVIEKWENDGYDDAINKFEKCLLKAGNNLGELKNKLKIYDEKGYKIFKNVYSCVMHGMEFNPLINTDIIKYFKDVNYSICQKGYNGMLIIFDEFSKFLEYIGNENMMKDLKIIQDFAELSSRTGKKEQILFSCITHKTINEYIKNLKEDKVNAFKTVEGRFKEIYFNRSMEQNYEIISQTISKNDNFGKFIDEKIEQKKELYNDIYNNFSFSRFDNYEDILFKGCFPLNPITTYSVTRLSEKVAQNERTLFTFLTDDDVNSFKYFINNNISEELFNVDRIYDYFRNIFKKDNDSIIRQNWIKAESAIQKLSDDIEKKIVKVLAVINMINDFEEIVPNYTTIAISLDITTEELEPKISSLIEKGIIKKKKTNKIYDFSTIYNNEVLKEIEKNVSTRFTSIDYKNTLEKVYDLGYIIPRKYNQDYKMTRFFKVIYLTENELLNLKSFRILKKHYESDGLIINLVRSNKKTKDIVDKVKEINDYDVIVKVPKESAGEELLQALKEYEAIEYITKTQNNDVEVEAELSLIQEENVELVRKYIDNLFRKENIEILIYGREESINYNLSKLTSIICEKNYSKTPLINNEMINKREVSTPIAKARATVIDAIINNDSSLIKSSTSPEATIYKAIFGKKENEDIKLVVSIIKKYIKESEKIGKRNFEGLIEKLTEKPYGIRNGIVPILLAIAFQDYSENIVLYYQNREVELNSVNISKIIDEPEKYYIFVEAGTQEKDEFVKGLMLVYGLKASENYRNNIKDIVTQMRKWALSLPRITRELTEKEILESVSPAYVKVKNELMKSDINNNEFLFIKMKSLFETDSYIKILKELHLMKVTFDSYLTNYTNRVIDSFKEKIEHNTTTNLNTLLVNWYDEIDDSIKNSIVRQETKKLFDYIKDMNTYNETEIIENISYSLSGNYIEDWQSNSYDNFLIQFDIVNEEIKSLGKISAEDKEMIVISDGKDEIKKYIDTQEITSLGSTLKNNIEDSLEEYGDSISESEKIKILLELIKKYM